MLGNTPIYNCYILLMIWPFSYYYDPSIIICLFWISITVWTFKKILPFPHECINNFKNKKISFPNVPYHYTADAKCFNNNLHNCFSTEKIIKEYKNVTKWKNISLKHTFLTKVKLLFCTCYIIF